MPTPLTSLQVDYLIDLLTKAIDAYTQRTQAIQPTPPKLREPTNTPACVDMTDKERIVYPNSPEWAFAEKPQDVDMQRIWDELITLLLAPRLAYMKLFFEKAPKTHTLFMAWLKAHKSAEGLQGVMQGTSWDNYKEPKVEDQLECCWCKNAKGCPTYITICTSCAEAIQACANNSEALNTRKNELEDILLAYDKCDPNKFKEINAAATLLQIKRIGEDSNWTYATLVKIKTLLLDG